MDKPVEGLFDCESKGGKCILEWEECPKGMEKSLVFNCPKKDEQKQVCCLGIEET